MKIGREIEVKTKRCTEKDRERVRGKDQEIVQRRIERVREATQWIDRGEGERERGVQWRRGNNRLEGRETEPKTKNY